MHSNCRSFNYEMGGGRAISDSDYDDKITVYN